MTYTKITNERGEFIATIYEEEGINIEESRTSDGTLICVWLKSKYTLLACIRCYGGTVIRNIPIVKEAREEARA